MPIYTKTGDKGTTSLFGGRRVSKTDCQIEAYASIDELTSFIGLLISLSPAKHKKFLITIQKDLYSIMGTMAGAQQDMSRLETSVVTFEKQIDSWEKKLPKLTRFILPGGTTPSAVAHICRVTCRRAERELIRFFETTKVSKDLKNNREHMVKFLNRLSDLLFVLARKLAGGKEILT
jgi:cob(I)alamin adenosyltransferase